MKKNRFKDFTTAEKFLILFLAVVMLVGLAALSWIASCGIIKLITLCLGISFSWRVATAVWLIAIFVNWMLKGFINGYKRSN